MADTGATLLRDVERYYAGRLKEHGATARGVDWNSAESQELRFDQLARLWEGETGALDVIDYGCGYGALFDHLKPRSSALRYQGFDVSVDMIAATSTRADEQCRFTARRDELTPADWVVASGLFNVRLSYDDAAWTAYMRRTIADMASLARRGIAFNALTSFADADKKRADLYYADPGEWLDWCKRNCSPRVALLHDYALYEWTVLVRK